VFRQRLRRPPLRLPEFKIRAKGRERKLVFTGGSDWHYEGGRFNLGNGSGFSVFEVIDSVRRVTGREIAVEIAPRRSGDPARLVADATRATAELGWRPQYPELDTIVAHAWRWEQSLG